MSLIECYFSNETKEKILNFYDEKSKNSTIYPPRHRVFQAFDECSYKNVKVIIIGQDPYSHYGQANGLAFSVNVGTPLPPSLKNIYKEIENEFGSVSKNDGDLTYLSKQGVLLLNTILTVEDSKPLSHKVEMYDSFFKEVIGNIEKKKECVVYMLWGAYAKKFKKLVTNPNHYCIETNHPSPLSANMGGWFNQNQFKKCNEILEKNSMEKIQWN